MRKNIIKQAAILIVTGLLFIPSMSKSQVLEPSIGLGLTTYIGDLPSYQFENGTDILFGGAVGAGLKYYPNQAFDIRANLFWTMLRGDDQISNEINVQRRNLSFRAPVVQFDLRGEWNILGFMPGSKSTPFTPFVSAGVGLIYFNPQARYQNAWVNLHPLGTEGQGIAAFPDRKAYQRIQAIVPMGGGIKINLNNKLTLTIEGTFHFTFTDYLDDVSTSYVTYPVLLEERGMLTAALADRTGEFLGTGPDIKNTGAIRGNPSTDDYYFSGLISIGYAIQSNIKGGFRYTGQKLKCPKF